jgi:hypothetical protein
MALLKLLDNLVVQQNVVLRISRLRSDLPAAWGRMNAEQMVRHLAETFRMALKELEVDSCRGFLNGPFGRFLVLYLPVRWPKGYPTLPELDAARLPPCDGEFEQSKSELLALVGRFCRSEPGQLLPEHPILGKMSHREWMRWGYLHTDHHLRQFGC